MTNMMMISGYKAAISFDAENGLFRGEFLGLNGGADFYADSVENLKKEGQLSLQVFLDICKEKGISPRKHYSGKFQVRLSPQDHERAIEVAAARGVSLNQFVRDALISSITDENRPS